jgi:hypothetical protein
VRLVTTSTGRSSLYSDEASLDVGNVVTFDCGITKSILEAV